MTARHWRYLRKLADMTEEAGVKAAETALHLHLHGANRPTCGDAYAATADVLKVLAWAMAVSGQQRSDAAISELADIVNEWAAGQRVSFAAANN